MARHPPAAGKARLYPTTRDGQPLLTNWLNNHRLDDYPARGGDD